MIKLLADENLDDTIIRSLLRRNLNADIVRIQDIGLSGFDDLGVLEWATNENRVLLTHDMATIMRYAYERITAGLSMPETIEVHTDTPIGSVIEDLMRILEYGNPEDLDGKIDYLPW